ncbi:MAG TPA: glycosyltransferase family 1 protein [Phycisphaerae bacterium]|nr:glycosyltransferase family 1 protein [Phycisphaerae bacterium]
MLRIAVNSRFLTQPLTGVQRYCCELLKAVERGIESGRLDSQHCRIRLLCPRGPRRDPGLRRLAVQPLGLLRSHLWEQIELPLMVGPRLLFSPGNTGPLAVRRQVVVIHDMSAFDVPAAFRTAFGRWYRWLVPRLVRRATRVVAVSEFTRSRIIHWTGVERDRVVVIRHGVDGRFAPAGSERIEQARSALGIPPGRYVLSLGAIEPRKNLAGLLTAWGLLQGRVAPDVWLVVAGGRGAARVFAAAGLADLPPRVHMTGRVDEEHLAALYSGALALAYPSFYEGFGLPPLEAMACGTPVVVSDRASLPEVVGDAGLRVDPDDADSIAEGIAALVADDALCGRLAAEGLRRARQFTWDRTAEATWAVLRQAAARLQ